MVDPATCCNCGGRPGEPPADRLDVDAARGCTTSCRRCGLSKLDRVIETQMLDILAKRGPGKTICPSKVARAGLLDAPPDASGGDENRRWVASPDGPTRRTAARLAAAGEVDVTQGGRVVDLSTATGPIRLRRKP